jgi:hypothetical protein
MPVRAGEGTRPYAAHVVLFPAYAAHVVLFPRPTWLFSPPLLVLSNAYVFFSTIFFSAVAPRLVLAQPSLTT